MSTFTSNHDQRTGSLPTLTVKFLPDQRYSYVLFLSPAASRTGAPTALLQLLRWFKAHTDLRFKIILYQDGPLAADFAALAPTVTLTEIGVGRSKLVRWIGRIPLIGKLAKWIWHRIMTTRVVEEQPCMVYANSVAAASLLRQIVPLGLPLTVHVHELEYAIKIAAGPHGMSTIKALARRYVAMSSAVRQNLVANHGIEPSLIETIPSFIPIDESLVNRKDECRRTMCKNLNIPDNAMVVVGCGATDWRKGVDLFVEMAEFINEKLKGYNTHFVWVGKIFNDEFTNSVKGRVQEQGLSSKFHFVGEQSNPLELFCGSDLFVLSSREEPMGLVALEAASVGKPIVCFADVGGMPDFVADECGKSVSPMTGEALGLAVFEILSSEVLRNSMGRRAFEKVRTEHHIDVIAPRILGLIKNEVQR